MSAERESSASGPGRRSAARSVRGTSSRADTEDTALRSLSIEDRARLSIDAWEPSLLRKLLQAQGRLKARSRRRESG